MTYGTTINRLKAVNSQKLDSIAEAIKAASPLDMPALMAAKMEEMMMHRAIIKVIDDFCISQSEDVLAEVAAIEELTEELIYSAADKNSSSALSNLEHAKYREAIAYVLKKIR